MNDRPPIRVLPPEVAARIAAGEVIERPASVVKELVENALDAGATRIEVEIEGGGADRIRVSDDGHGIPPEQVADAFERHATSKLRSEHDLYAVRTLGFRGEALAAIAAAADVDLVSRPAAQTAGATLRLRNGKTERQGSAAAAPGTSIEVRDLFASLPARRRFLRATRSETQAVARVVTDYALAYPEVAFRLTADGRNALAAPGSGDPRDAVAAVHGADVAALLLPAHAERAAAIEGEAEPARCEVVGLVGPPSLHRASRAAIHVVANGRAVVARALLPGVELGYEGLLPGGRHPVALIRITVPPDQVDVNVHPQKAEVRFRHERLVFATVQAAVRAALAGTSHLAPDSPDLASMPGIAATPGTLETEPRSWPGFDFGTPAGPASADVEGLTGRDVIAGARIAPMVERDTAAPRADAGVPLLRPLGQVESTYIVAESSDGMVLVDQHAAHERVLYEQVRARLAAGERPSQPLLQSVLATLSAPQAALLAGGASDLEAIGWEVEAADGAAVIVRAVPAALAGRDVARALTDYLDRLDAEERLSGPDRAAATLACRAAVMAGDRLDATQQRALLDALARCDTPHTCPHGRPTMLHLSRASLERSFGRR
ncbi:MAG: DNA mismatch repair endonuclease MutL [Chloroflexi bacterium]|nr:MAG: DNA mismatch repair endonuclease MutL [Chloroflexota bacterium]